MIFDNYGAVATGTGLPDTRGEPTSRRFDSDLPNGACVSGEFTVGGQQCYPLDRGLGHQDAIERIFVCGREAVHVDRMFALSLGGRWPSAAHQRPGPRLVWQGSTASMFPPASERRYCCLAGVMLKCIT